MTEIELTESTLIIHLKGLAKIVAFMCMVPLEIPLTHVVDIVVDPHVVEKWDQIEGPLGSVLDQIQGPPRGGSVSMEVFQKKWSWGAQIYPEGGHLQRVFLIVNDPHKAITIKLTDELYTMLVLKVTDPAATAARIGKAVQLSLLQQPGVIPTPGQATR
jgi:hypothetical protein